MDSVLLIWLELLSLPKTPNDLESLEKCSNMFGVISYCTFSLGLSVLFHIQMGDLFLEWTEQIKKGFPDDELWTLAAGTIISDALVTEQEL